MNVLQEIICAKRKNITIGQSGLYSFADDIPSIENVTIFDVLGKKVLQPIGNIQQLDISFLQNGMYFLKIATQNGDSVKKIVKK